MTRRPVDPNRLCAEGGNVHTWQPTGLDINGSGELVSTRECLRCPLHQEKPYGAGSRRSWRPALAP